MSNSWRVLHKSFPWVTQGNFGTFYMQKSPRPHSVLQAGRGLGTRLLANVVCPRCALASAMFWLRHCRYTGTSIWVWTLACMQKLGRCGGMLPQENVFQFDAVRWLLRLFLAQNTTVNLCFSPGLVTGFWYISRLDAECMEIYKCSAVSSPRGTTRKSDPHKPVS